MFISDSGTTKRLNETIPPGDRLWLKPGDLLIQRSNTIDYVGTAAVYTGPPETYVYPDLMMLIRTKHPETALWLWRYLNSPKGRRSVTRLAAGAAGSMPKISGAKLRSVKVPLPPLPEQRRIVAILDKADAIRRKRREAVALTEELLRSAFLEMFGDPVTNPKGWPTVRLDSLVRPGDRINYGVVQPGPDVPSGRPLIRVTDIVTGHIDQTKMKLIAADIDAQYSRSKLVGDEVLVACVGSIGAVARAKAAHRGFNIARAVSRVPLCDAVETPYIEECLRSSFVQEYFRSQLRTVAQPTLNVKQLKATPIRLPPRKLQKHFARIQGQVHILRRKVRSSSVHDDTLFHSLVQRAFRGEL
jgi:type I restriction enzyme S subunit